MSNATRCQQKANKLGYTLDEDSFTIYLEAPAGHCFDQDHHEACVAYLPDLAGDKAEAWKEVWRLLGTAEVCRIPQCERCLANG